MKLLNIIFVLTILMTGGSVLGAEYLDIPWMYNLAALSFGLLAITGGLRTLITGKARGASVGTSQLMRQTRHTERHSGANARMIGVVVLMAGAIIITLSAVALTYPGGMDAFQDEFLRSPRAWGLVLALAGFMVTLMGIMRARAGTASGGAYGETVEAEFRGTGIIMAVAGVAMLVLAAILIIAPGVFQGTLDDLFSKMGAPKSL